MLVIGAARRVGAQIVTALHDAGMNIVLHYRHSRAQAEALTSQLETRCGNSVIVVQADLLKGEILSSLLETAATA